MWGRVPDCLIKFRVIVACCKSLYHNLRWNTLSTLHSNATKWFLDVWIYLSVLFALRLLGGTNWYLMFMEFIVIYKALYDSLPIKVKPGLIPLIFKSSVNYVKALIVSLSLLLFVVLVRMVLQSNMCIT